jgi:hypothetical protein
MRNCGLIRKLVGRVLNGSAPMGGLAMRRIKLLLLGAAVLLLTACTAQAVPERYDISDYIEAFEAMDFEAMWEQVSPDAKVDKDTFLSKHRGDILRPGRGGCGDQRSCRAG